MLRKRKHYQLRDIELERNDGQRARHDLYDFVAMDPEIGDKVELVGWRSMKSGSIRSALAMAVSDAGLNGRIRINVYDLGPSKKPRAWLTWLG